MSRLRRIKTCANLSQLLVLDPEKRISLDEVQRHPWIVKHCVKGDRAAQRISAPKETADADAQPV
jgi:aurora kinase